MKNRAVLLLLLALLTRWPVQAMVCSDSTRTPVRTVRMGHGTALAVQLSTTGVGLQIAHRLPVKPRLYARLGLSYFAYRQVIRLKAEGDGRLDIRPDLDLSLALASLKWYPFRQGGFYLTGGGGYAGQPSLGLLIQAENKITFGGLEMTPENVGTIDARFRWNHLVGYAGLGIGRTIPRSRFGFGAELGCYYLGIPQIDLHYEGFLETTTIQEQIPTIERNLSGYRYLPSLQFLLTYVIHR